MCADEPLAELTSRFIRRGSVERHERRAATGHAGDLGAPPIDADLGNFDQVLAAVDDLFEATNGHDDCNREMLSRRAGNPCILMELANASSERITEGEVNIARARFPERLRRKMSRVSNSAQAIRASSTRFPHRDPRARFCRPSCLTPVMCQISTNAMLTSGRTARRRLLAGATIVAVTLVASSASVDPAVAQDAQAVLYRIFLADGSTLVSYGDFARVADRVVFSMPVEWSRSSGSPRLQLVNIPASAVDWAATDRYAASARAEHYAATRGEADFTRLSGQVAWALNEIALSKDPARRLQLAEAARRSLAEWSRDSLGYRASEVADLASLLDEVVSEMRAAAGVDRFEFNLVASTGPPPPVPMLPRPNLRESIEQVLAAARLTQEPAGRIDLLRTAMSMLDGSEATLPASWVVRTRVLTISELSAELRVDSAYAALTSSTLKTADAQARQANVRGLESLIAKALERDDALGRKRPDVMSGLLGALDAKIEAARRLRLARDGWALRRPAYQKYRSAIDRPLSLLAKTRSVLEDIRWLAGPSPANLRRTDQQLDQASAALSRVTPPQELESVHALLKSVVLLAKSACRVRRQALESGEMAMAWDASSAAAGALSVLARATGDLQRLLRPPELP